jgi:SAM-dependent methyltransferase
MKEAYTQIEFDEFLSNVEARHGWDFSRMKTMRQAVPWDYLEEVKERLQPSYDVLDVGTGGGERFSELARYFRTGLGVDIDPGMIAVAQENARSDSNLTFLAMDEKLADLGRGLRRHYQPARTLCSHGNQEPLEARRLLHHTTGRREEHAKRARSFETINW